jgi:hypothetical protein
MRRDRIKLAERFSDVELASMFTVDCDPECDREDGSRMEYVDGLFEFNDVKIPLWVLRKRQTVDTAEKSTQFMPRLFAGDDEIRDLCEIPNSGIPGSDERIHALATYYENQKFNGTEYSPFDLQPTAESENAEDEIGCPHCGCWVLRGNYCTQCGEAIDWVK